ncbi:hypothetical protein J5N97_027853 [Dioscorea zingiberensis]|uniref:Uncharacterized protein n=1 Tax=Dioscorea zingiberensis TaxID=325984 RepID=A0A9D5H4D1_9LILI|nr:hypothetical protein J5N97_027853 [Dioscorea zingiberensis]
METGRLGKRGRNETEETVGGTRDVTDDEVDEFFAIIRRIREARRQLTGLSGAPEREEHVTRRKKNEDDGISRWTPVFKWEDFERPNSDAEEEPAPAEEPITPRLDLNEKPEPVSPFVQSPDDGEHTDSVITCEKD